MNIFTHRFLANKIKIKLEQKINFNFITKELLWGNIKPDIIKGKVPHIKKGNTFDQFFNLLTEINNINPITERKLFSRKFGKMIHFVCDYFCKSHNNHYLVDNILPHLKYEYYLHKFAKKMNYDLINIDYTNYHQFSLLELVHYKHNLFCHIPPSFQRDINNSFATSLLLGQKILASHFTLKEAKPHQQFRYNWETAEAITKK